MSSALSEADIKRVVKSFYTEVQNDPILSPIFATKIKVDEWDAHMAHIETFWVSIFLKSRRFDGNPMQKHAAIKGLTPVHFTHWLALFETVTNQCLEAPKAKAMQLMASRIGKSLQMGLAYNYEKSGIDDHPFREFGLSATRSLN